MMTRLGSPLAGSTPALRGALFYFGYWGVFGVYDPLINVYFSQLGLSGSQIGLLAGLVPLMTLLVALPVSALADKRAMRVSALSIALAGLAAMLLFLGLPKTFVAILLVAALLSAFRAPTGPISDSLVVRMSVRHGVDFGMLRLWGSVGFAISAILFGWIWGEVGYGWMFATAALLFVPVVVVSLSLEEGPKVARKAQRPLREFVQDRGLVILLIATFLAEGGLLVSSFFGGIYLVELGGSAVMVGVLFALLALTEIPSMRWARPLMIRFGGPRTLLLAYLVCAAAVLGFALAPGPTLFLVAAALRGLGYGLFFVATVRLLDSRVPQEWASSVQALMYAGGFGLSPLLASLAAGVVYDAIGGRAVFFGTFLMIAAGGILLAIAGAAGILRQPKSLKERI